MQQTEASVPAWLKDILDVGRGIFKDVANIEREKDLLDIAREQLRFSSPANAAPVPAANAGGGGLLSGVSTETIMVAGIGALVLVLLLKR